MKKSAVCVGVNTYPFVNANLQGCLNDAHFWLGELTARGYLVLPLLDVSATRRGILDALDGLVDSLEPGDSGVFTFSGHGTRIPVSPTEYEDAICPSDLQDVSQLVQGRELFAAFGRLKPGVRFTFVSDSCHSGTNYRDLEFDFASGLPFPSSRCLQIPGLPSSPPPTFRSRMSPLPETDVNLVRVGDLEGVDFLHVAACRDAQTAADAHFDDSPPMGALTYYLKSLLRNFPLATTADVAAGLAKWLPSARYPQAPVLHVNNADRELAPFPG